MRIVQTIVVKLLSLFVIVLGSAFVVMPFSDKVTNLAWGLTSDLVWGRYGALYGLALFLLGLLGFLPLTRGERKKNVISFPGTHGEVTIELESVEATLSRFVSKMPVVKKISVRVTPSEDKRRAEVTANVWMYKGADPASAREIANRISDHLADTAVNILGVEDVTTVNLNVRGIIVNLTPAAPAPKLEEQATPTAAHVAVEGETPPVAVSADAPAQEETHPRE